MSEKMTVPKLKRLGFDRATRDGKYLKVRCSQCQAAAINGVPCHEHGCPNMRRGA